MPPSFHHLTDEYEPTNPALWKQVLEVARGDVEELVLGDRTVHKPEKYVWPSPPASAWAVKQYNGFGGNWRKRAVEDKYQRKALRILLAGGIVTTCTPQEHGWMAPLQIKNLTQRIRIAKSYQLWDAGWRIVRAGLVDDLQRRMRILLTGQYDWLEARRVGEWLDNNFRVDSPKTPKGGKQLKAKLQLLSWVLKHRVVTGTPQLKHPLTGEPIGKSLEDVFRASQGGDPVKQQKVLDKAQAEVRDIWAGIEPQIPFLREKFTDEGGTVVPKELTIGGVTYRNGAGIQEPQLKKYVQRISSLLGSLKGWRAKALKGGLTVVLANPKDFRGTAGGKYRRSEDALYIRTTPAVLKRAAGYGSFDYIVVHELGHRYEKFYGTGGVDFDRPRWWTTRYSRTEGMAGSESFAELFALGHFRLSGNWDPDIIDRFETVMTGGKEN